MTSLTIPCARSRKGQLLFWLAAWIVVVSCGASDTQGGNQSPIRAAVAANFAAPQQELARRFESATGIAVETSLGSTGQLYAQISNGAPYDVFLAADGERPRQLELARLAVPRTRFTYAVGRLALYAPQWDSLPAGAAALGTRTYLHLAIADPLTAPYGAAAREVLQHWQLWDRLRGRIVRGANVGQVLQFVQSGAAEVGFVAVSQLMSEDPRSYWIVPQQLHDPIRQDAVLLQHGARKPAARRYLEFLQSDQGFEVLAAFGYERP